LKFFRLIDIAIFLVFSININAQWQEVHPEASINQIHYKIKTDPTDSNFYLIGNTISTSVDNGASWEYQKQLSTPERLHPKGSDIEFVGGDTVFFSNYNKIYKSLDGGVTWNIVFETSAHIPSVKSSGYIKDLEFISSAEGFAVGTMDKIFKTKDGGISWDTISISSEPKPYRTYQSIRFLDDSVGYIGVVEKIQEIINFGYSYYLLKTTDGGLTWTENQIWIEENMDYGHVNVVPFSEDLVFLIFDSAIYGKILKTTDDGITHQVIPYPANVSTTQAVSWVNDSIGIVYAEDYDKKSNNLYRTTNAGKDWEVIDLDLPETHYNDLICDIYFNHAGVGIMTGEGGYIARSENDGLTWEIINRASLSLHGIQFTNDQNGFAVQGYNIMKTEDGGRNWFSIEHLDSLYVYGLELEDENNGILYGYNHYNYVLKNGVVTQLDLPTFFFQNTVFTKKGNTIYGVGIATTPFRPVVIHSTDNGENWLEMNVADSGFTSLTGLHIDEDTTIYVHTSGALYRHVKGSEEWDALATFDDKNFIRFGHISKRTIVAHESGGGVYYSNDGGLNWSQSDMDEDVSISGFISKSPSVTYAYGHMYDSNNFVKGKVYSSLDSGKHWTEEFLADDLFSSINSMSLGIDSVFVSCGFGRIFKSHIPTESTSAARHDITDQSVQLYFSSDDRNLFLQFPNDTRPNRMTLYNLKGQTSTFKIMQNTLGEYYASIPRKSPGVYVAKIFLENNKVIQSTIVLH